MNAAAREIEILIAHGRKDPAIPFGAGVPERTSPLLEHAPVVSDGLAVVGGPVQIVHAFPSALGGMVVLNAGMLGVRDGPTMVPGGPAGAGRLRSEQAGDGSAGEAGRAAAGDRKA